MAQALPQRAWLLFLEELPPEENGGHRHAAQADLQDVEDHDGDGETRPEQRTRIGEIHGIRSPRVTTNNTNNTNKKQRKKKPSTFVIFSFVFYSCYSCYSW